MKLEDMKVGTYVTSRTCPRIKLGYKVFKVGESLLYGIRDNLAWVCTNIPMNKWEQIYDPILKLAMEAEVNDFPEVRS